MFVVIYLKFSQFVNRFRTFSENICWTESDWDTCHDTFPACCLHLKPRTAETIEQLSNRNGSDIKHPSRTGQLLITAAEQTFVRPGCTSTDRPGLNRQAGLNGVYDAWSMASKPLKSNAVWWWCIDQRVMNGGWGYISQAFPQQQQNRQHQDEGTMLSLAVVYLAAVVGSARWTRALPPYPDGNMETDTGAAFPIL